jgi:hypothetical protein
MTALDLHRPNTIFAILQGLKTTMNSQAKPSQAKPSQAKPSQAKQQCSACHEGICLKLPPGSWSLHDGFCKQSRNKQSKPIFTKTLN